MMKEVLAQLIDGGQLTVEQATHAFELIMTGQSEPAQTAALLALIQMRGPAIAEIVGAARVMRQKASPVQVPADLVAIDTCGTGGDHTGTFNISTAAALVAAGAGRPHQITVAKHGNRSVTSKSGSSQVLESLGVKLQVSASTLTRCLDQAGICFCFAPAHHPAMKYAAPVRAALGFRTLFNILGPLTNPAGARRQIIGVFSNLLTEPLALVLKDLGAKHAMVFNGRILNHDGTLVGTMDEISISGPTRISHLKDGRVDTYELDPQTAGITVSPIQSLQVDTPEQSAQLIKSVLAGEKSAARQIVCLNAAAAMVVADIAADLIEGAAMAVDAIDSGAAKKALNQLVQITQADQTPAG